MKKFIPRTLYGRFLLIIVAPILVIQLVSIYVFYYTHLDVISKHMARSVVAEMEFITNSVGKENYQEMLEDFSGNVGLDFSFQEKRRLKKNKKIGDSAWKKSAIYKYINPLVDPYNRLKSELKNYNLTPYQIYENPENEDLIIVKVQTKQGVISFDVPVKRIATSSAYVFTFWMILTAAITSIISIIFLKNQVRTIRELSSVAEKFGRGQEVGRFKPTGSQEIRSLAISFIKMKERLRRQILQRTDMLSAVSHDLRTPLTRMKLQLAMIKNQDEVQELNHDISDMEKLIEEYLDFAKKDDKEKILLLKVKKFLQEKIINYYKKMNKEIDAKLEISGDLQIVVKELSLKRALINLLDNAFNHANKVALTSLLSDNNLLIKIEDDGPGIPENERAHVFKPFYRVDSARNLDKRKSSAGSGLGLAIAMDAITSLGGNIKLSDSKELGGLCVTIYIPKKL